MKYIGQIFLFLLFFSCQKFSWHNPYDPECPKDLFTPENFTAQLESKAIRIRWQQSNTQISGFEILRSVDGGNNTSIVSLGKEATSYLDTDVQDDKQYKYFIVAKAGDNKSKELTTVIVFKVQPPITLPIEVVTIGTQVWQLQNLDVVTYRNGDTIPQVTDRNAWGQLTTGAWCWYANNSANGTTYGRLYNWYAVNDPRGLAPAGYHIPTDAEWTTLTNYLGGESVAGGKMKSTTNWQNPNTGATNSSGFRGLPGGYRSISEDFNQIGVVGGWWSATEYDTGSAWIRILDNISGTVISGDGRKWLGLSVRCIKD
jgi:uncharacterized protein (TIGR02145 family)